MFKETLLFRSGGVFPQTVGQDKMPDETFEPYRKIAVIDEEGKIESPGIPPQRKLRRTTRNGKPANNRNKYPAIPRIASEFRLKPMYHLADSRMTVGIVVNSAVKLNTLGYIRRMNSYRSFPLQHRLQNCPTVLFCSDRKGIHVPDSS